MKYGRVETIGSVFLGLCLLAACNTGDDRNEVDNATMAQQALHSSNVLQPINPSVCFVQDSASTLTAVQFQAATDVMKNVIQKWDDASGLVINWRGVCTAPVVTVVNGATYDTYSEDIRIFYNEFSRASETTIPGRGCGQTNSNGNWGGYPADKPGNVHCKWNASLAINQPINNYLHEFGHTLGFYHEQVRSDNNVCAGADLSGAQDGVLITDYDVYSVMGYINADCGAPGNLGNTGLSDRDRLGAEIAYPASSTVNIASGGFFGGGKAVVRDNAILKPEWIARGATMFAVISPIWSNNGVQIGGNVSIPSTVLPQGAPANLALQYQDPWGRSKQGMLYVEVSNSKHAAITMSIL